MVNVIFKMTDYELHMRKKEVWDRYNKIIQWGRQHPVRFMEIFFGLEFTDHQKFVLLSTWQAQFVTWVMSRSSGKSYLSAPYLMARSVLIPNHRAYILNVTGGQSQETFKKIEDLATGNLASASGTTQVFLGELIKEKAGDSGFVHDKNSHSLKLYNGARINTLNSVAKNIVGIRSNLNWYDEAGKIERDFFELTKPFVAQDTDFITGSKINIDCLPKKFPNQIILTSSAEDIFTALYDSYREAAIEMAMGNKDYFVCDIDCSFSLHPMMNGKPYRPLLKQSVIDEACAKNIYKANREYFNKFDVTGGQDALTSMAIIEKNSSAYLPVFKNKENKKYLIIYDPSTKLDNSVVLVCEIFRDENKGYMLRIVNCHNLIERTPNGIVIIKQKPEQVKILKEMLVNYNGNVDDYDNIERIIIDDGAGGGGYESASYMLPNWKTSAKEHRGIIDKKYKYQQNLIDQYPEACDVLTLETFKKNKVFMYESAQDAIAQGLVIFPKSVNSRNEIEYEVENEDGIMEIKRDVVSGEELRALVEIDMLKYELIAMEKNEKNGVISFDTMPSKKNAGVKDDRADCVAMACGYLKNLRFKDNLINGKSNEVDLSKLFPNKQAVASNPFFGHGNPFLNRGTNPFN